MKKFGLFLIALVLSGCQCGNQATVGSGDGNPDGSVNSDGGPNAGLDGGPDGGGCAPLNGACVQASCCTGLSCASGVCQTTPSVCGLNSQLCSGTCTVVLTDPSNCGGCGIQCGANQVCTGGTCQSSGSCPQGLTACQGSCVDLQTSNAHCGSCTHPCPAGQGCAGGNCVPSVVLDGGSPPSCPAGGPPITVTGDGGTVCSGSLAQVTFRWAMCSCADIRASSSLRTDAFNSAVSRDAGLGGGVGANGSFIPSSTFDIGGAAWFGSSSGLSASGPGPNYVRQQLRVNGPASANSTLVVGDDAYVNGNASGNLSIQGKLYVPQGATVGPNVQASGGVIYGPVSVPPPCDCDASKLIDVASIVRDGQLHNDNAAIGLDPAVLENVNTALRLDLPCGRYYLTQIRNSAPVAIVVHGRAALFIGGDVRPSGSLAITIDAQAELDVFVGGSLVVSQSMSLGSTEVPAQTRVYLAGPTASVSASATLAGNFYLPYAMFSPSAPFTLYGSLFCGSYVGSQSLQVHYDRAILSAGTECNSPPLDGGTGCSSCRDCANQACVSGTCGPCTSDSQCCAPLVCRQGACVMPLN